MARMYLLVGAWLVLCFVSVSSVDVTILDPETLQDGENFADKDSNITYKKIKDDYSYKAAQKVDIGPLETFYGLARSIISTSLPGDFPIDWALKIKDGKLVIGDDWQPLVKDYLGYIIAIAVGLLFIILSPIIGFCFCCCRCCGRCGGGRYIKNPDDAGFEKVCARRAWIIILTVITVMALTGSALMFATNENVSDSLERIKDQDVDKLDDVTAFFDSVIDQTSVLVHDNFNFTWKVLIRDLDNIGYLLGQPIKDDVIQNSGLQATYDEIDSMEVDAKKLNDSLKILNEEKQKLLSAGPKFDTFIDHLQTSINSAITSYPNLTSECPHYNLTSLSFKVDQLPNEVNKSVALSIFLQSGISALTKQSRDDLNAIPERIQNETQSKREDVKNQAGNYTNKIKEITDNVQKIRDDFLGDLDFNNFKKNAKDLMDFGIKYDKYRWYGGIGLACVTLLISLLLGLGLLCGLFGGNAFTDPTERSAISNHGGNILTSAIMLFFIFAWLIMLVTTVLFVAGAPTEKFGCRTLDDLSTLEKVITDLKLVSITSGKSWLGEMIYPGKGVNLSISEVMMACQSGKSAYTSLKMEEGNIFNLSQITDYSQSINFGDQISQFNVNFGGLNITSGPMIDFIDFMTTFDDNMNYTGYDSILNNNKVNQSNTFFKELSDYMKKYPGTQTNLKSINDDLNNELTHGNGSIAKNSIDRIFQALEAIKDVTQKPTNNTLNARSSNLKSNLSHIESQLPKITNDTFRNSISNFESRLKKIFDKFTNDIKQKVENDLGKCTPLWNIYNSVLKESICQSTIGAVNGWWCALGWTIFFLLLSTCSSVVTSKHFFRMKYISDQSSNTHEKEKVHHFKNQVFHTDTNTDKWNNIPHGIRLKPKQPM
ncbi:hypothetical protein Btru_016917 [Bulinus truncatus]|nr:hypothetical protein Btru_016917 [Bulinus truncatus]